MTSGKVDFIEDVGRFCLRRPALIVIIDVNCRDKSSDKLDGEIIGFLADKVKIETTKVICYNI